MWFKVDDHLHSHPKTVAAGNEAMGLWIRLGSHCACHLTDGDVSPDILALFDPVGNATAKLLETGWLVKDEEFFERKAYRLHNYLDYQPSRKDKESLSKKRAKAGKQKGSKREAKPEQSETTLLSKSDAKGTGTGTGTGSLNKAVPDPVDLVWEEFTKARLKRYPKCRRTSLDAKRKSHIRARLKDVGKERIMSAIAKFFDRRFFWAKADHAKSPHLLFQSLDQFEKVENASEWNGSGGQGSKSKPWVQSDQRPMQQLLSETVVKDSDDDQKAI